MHHVTGAAAGHGAAREFCDLLLVATGHYASLLAETLGFEEIPPYYQSPIAGAHYLKVDID